MITKYAYDAVGRMVREGTKSYRYGYLDKVLSVTEGKNRITYGYHVDGQLATVTKGHVTEELTWDGLALVKRGTTSYVNEPHPGGGAPVVSSNGGVMFNDILGTTLGVCGNDCYVPSSMTAFGDTINCQLPTANFFIHDNGQNVPLKWFSLFWGGGDIVYDRWLYQLQEMKVVFPYLTHIEWTFNVMKE